MREGTGSGRHLFESLPGSKNANRVYNRLVRDIYQHNPDDKTLVMHRCDSLTAVQSLKALIDLIIQHFV